jgi:hypothetical protein
VDRQEKKCITTGALGPIKTGLDQNLQLLPGHKLVIELPKITLISTAHIINKCSGKSLECLYIPEDCHVIMGKNKFKMIIIVI